MLHFERVSVVNMTSGRVVLLLCAVFSCAKCNPLNFAQKPFTIEEATLGGFSVESFSGKWISDNEIEYTDKVTKDVKVYNAVANKTTVVLEASVLQKYKATKHEFSPDRKFVLLTYDEQPMFRHSKKFKFAVYSIATRNYSIYDNYVQVVEWSPKTNNLVFIRDNDIYYVRNINTSTIQAIAITNYGRPGVIFNGIGDWVYEEEILSSGKAFWFSPEGDQLAFVAFLDINVTNATIVEYGEPRDMKYQYTKQVGIAYPKAGSSNPTYYVRHIAFKDPQKVNTIAEYGVGQEVFNNLMWLDNNVIIYTLTNRVQNEARFYWYSVEGHFGQVLDFLTDINKKGWANTNMPRISKDQTRFLRIAGSEVAKLGKFKHLLVTHSNRTTFDLTPGVIEVLNIVYWKEKERAVYYLATEAGSATATQLYYTREYPGSQPVCLTCKIKSPEGKGCKEASASFSKNGSYVLVTCNGPDPKVVYLYKNTLPLGLPLAELENNSKLRSQLKEKLMPEVMNLTIEISGNFKADVRLLLPPNLDRSGKTKYPLVIYVYGGPASKNINDAFKLDWGLYMSTNLGIIYGMIDGRNTLRKGENMLFAGYRALGTLEMEDQISVTSLLRKMLCFIDPARVGIWGWSYGGYATTKVLEMDKDVFKCGIAVAPVADWMYYDSMYTERYMGLPSENKQGYERASVLTNVTNLENKQYFLIHGNADDNVHYQNAMLIAKTLQKKNIPFELMSYPDEDHSLRHVRKHLYYTMSRFWKKCFNLR